MTTDVHLGVCYPREQRGKDTGDGGEHKGNGCLD